VSWQSILNLWWYLEVSFEVDPRGSQEPLKHLAQILNLRKELRRISQVDHFPVDEAMGRRMVLAMVIELLAHIFKWMLCGEVVDFVHSAIKGQVGRVAVRSSPNGVSHERDLIIAMLGTAAVPHSREKGLFLGLRDERIVRIGKQVARSTAGGLSDGIALLQHGHLRKLACYLSRGGGVEDLRESCKIGPKEHRSQTLASEQATFDSIWTCPAKHEGEVVDVEESRVDVKELHRVPIVLTFEG
jgi:hypothetical protein